ncbi:MAG: glycosyltransferase family 39 protein [Nitrospirota bacterium]
MSLPEADTLIFFFINKGLQNKLTDLIMIFLTGRSYLLVIPFLVWFFLKGWKKTSLVLTLSLISLLLSDWASYNLKEVFERPRPCNVLEGVRLLVGCSSSHSMPSGHAVTSFAFVTPFLIFFRSRINYIFCVFAFLVGFSRVYVGVHYPSDVLVGILVGVMSATSVSGLYKKAYERFKEKPYTTVLFIFLLALSLFRIYYVTRGSLDLSPDEAHYWEWSRRLDWGYYSKGPMIAYLIYIGTSIFGDTVFGIRIMAVVFSILSSITLYSLGKSLYDEKVGLFSAILIQIIPLFSTFGMIFTIDSPLIFFWILSLYLFHLSTESTNPSIDKKGGWGGFDPSPLYWRLLGLSIGFGLLTKYTMAFFYVFALLYLLISKERRKFLLMKGPYIAFLVSLIVFSPVIIWNASHGWVALKHTAGQAHLYEGFKISLKSIFEFLGSQLGVITPLLFVLMIMSLWKLRREKEGSFLFLSSIPLIAFFLLKSIQAKVQANWALPGYITGIIAFSAFYGKGITSSGIAKKILIIAALVIALIVTSLAHYPSILNLPVKKDPTSRLLGWKEIGEEISKIYEKMSAEGPVFIFSDKYQVSSELAFYVRGHPITYCINLGRRMNQYDLWPGFYDLIHHDAIFVKMEDTEVPEKVEKAFSKIEKRLFTACSKNKKIRDYSIFLCYDFKGLKEEKPRSY